MVNDRKDDLEILLEREMQIKELVSAHTWDIKQGLRDRMDQGLANTCKESGLPQRETDKAGITTRRKDKAQANQEVLALCQSIGYSFNQYSQQFQMQPHMLPQNAQANLALMGVPGAGGAHGGHPHNMNSQQQYHQ